MIGAVKDAIKVFSGQTASFVIRFLTSLLVAVWLGAEGKGLYASVLLVPTILITLGELGIRQSIVFYLGRKIYSINEIANTAFILLGIILIPMVSVCVIVYNTYYQGIFELSLQVIVMLIIPITLLMKILSGIFLGLNRVGVFSKVAWIPAVLELLLTVLLVYFIGAGIYGVIVATILSSLFTVSYGIFCIKDDIIFNKKFFSWGVAKAVVSKGILFAMALFIVQLNYRVDIFLLKSMVPMEAVGNYSVGISLAEILWQIPSAIAVVILARTATSTQESQKYKVALTLRVTFLLMVLIAVGMIIINNYLIPIIYGDEYLKSISVNRILMIGVVFFTFYKILNSRIAGLGKPQVTLVLFIPCLVLKIVGNLYLVPRYGIDGAAWSSNISYILASLLILIAFSKIEKISLKEILMPRKSDLDVIIKMVKR